MIDWSHELWSSVCSSKRRVLMNVMGGGAFLLAMVGGMWDINGLTAAAIMLTILYVNLTVSTVKDRLESWGD